MNDFHTTGTYGPPPADAQLAAILSAAPDAIISQTLDGIITSWNPAATQMFGYSAEEAIGRPISMIIPPDRGKEELEVLATLRRGEGLEPTATTRATKDGRSIPVLLTISPIRDASGNVIGASSIARNLCEQLSAMDQFRIERDRLRVTLASIGDAVIVTDARGFIDFLNPVAARLTGWSQDEAQGKPLESVFCIINESTRQRVESPATVAMREGVIVGLANHTILIARNGSEVAIDDSASPIRDENGKIFGVVLVFRDVTAVRAVEAFRERLSAIVESSDDAIVGKDVSGRITSWNKGAERIFGYSQQEALGRPITMLIPPDRLGEETEILRRLRSGDRVEHFETIRVAKDRRMVDVSLTISPIRDSEGTVIGASKIARDITEKKESERQLALVHEQLRHHAAQLDQLVQERTAELRDSLMDLEAFSSSLSHDLRAPLRSMFGMAEALRVDYGKDLPAGAKPMLDAVIDSCDRLSMFVDTVLSYMKARNTSIPVQQISLEQIVNDVLEKYPYVADAGAEVMVEEPLLPASGNAELLTQAVANLVSNAVKFVALGTKPRVRIATEQIGDRVRLLIEDNGIGINPTEQKNIFNLFTRARGMESYEGTGVGLAVVSRAVRRMGGSIGLDSKPDSGSRFWIELPAVSQPRVKES